jgi:hypothetical protein
MSSRHLKSISTIFHIKRFLKAGIAPFLLIIVFINLNTMWIHPDSMTSGGLRFLNTGIENFHYGTYGPFAFLFIGLLYAMLFPLGFIIGIWNDKAGFEIAYRTNYVGVLDVSFTKLSIGINIGAILLSLYLLSRIELLRTHRSGQMSKLIVIFFAIPISFFQFSLDTIEIFVFLGMSVALYASFSELKRTSAPGIKSCFLVACAFLLTAGLRINLIIFVIPVFFKIAYTKFRGGHDKKEWIPLISSCFIVFLTYLPILLNSIELISFIDMIKSLSSFQITADSIMRNLEVLFINFGLVGSILLLIGYAPNLIRKTRMANTQLYFLWTYLGLTQIILFLLNQNGFPKYLVPTLPIILMNSIFLFGSISIIDRKILRFVSRSLIYFVAILILIINGLFNFIQYQSISRFDTRQVLSDVIPSDINWTDSAVANVTVISELTRGKNGLEYDLLNSRIKTLDVNDPICRDIILLSSREVDAKTRLEIYRNCSSHEGNHIKLQIVPFKDLTRVSENVEWSGLLSLGTKADRNRIGYGPTYSVLVSTRSKYAIDFKTNCLASPNCTLTP